MTNIYRPSFLIIVALIFLLPLFFIPGGVLDLMNSKALLISLGAVVGSLFFLYESFRVKEISLPKHYLLLVAAILPLIYLLSALLSTPSSLSLFGYSLEIGTFGYILIGSIFLGLAAVTFSETSRALQAVLALFGSLTLLAAFSVIKILSGGEWLVLSNFPGNMGNPLGSWTDLAVVFTLLAVLVVLTLGMLPMKRSFKWSLYGLFAVLLVLIVVIHFSTAFILGLVAAVMLFFYFHRIESGFLFSQKSDGVGESEVREKINFFAKPTFLPLVLGVVCLIFVINPTFSGGQDRLGNVVSGAFGVINTEVRPTLSTTLGISKAVLSEEALLGSGPNTFSRDWMIYKPADVNVTPFWATTFLFGAGFIPTQIAATGIAGSVLWLAFYVLLLSLAFKLITQAPEGRAPRFVTMAVLVTALFIWISALLYTPSSATLMLGFVFVGVLLALGRSNGVLGGYPLVFKEGSYKTVGFALVSLSAVMVLIFGWVEMEKTLASFHFKRAVSLASVQNSDPAAVEEQLLKAINFAPLDIYYRGLSELNFSKAQAFANAATGTAEVNRAGFEEALGKSIEASRSAVSVNPNSYINWVSLGAIYSALVPAPLQIEGAYENAQFAYSEAYRRNPANPEIPLLLAQLEINRGNVEDARSYIRSAIALKENYADAYLLLARLEVSEKNLPVAIASAERLAALLPENAGVHFELGLLKQTNADHVGAAASFTRAIELLPEYANAKYYLALSLAEIGDIEGARARLEELLIQIPGNEVVEQALEALN